VNKIRVFITIALTKKDFEYEGSYDKSIQSGIDRDKEKDVNEHITRLTQFSLESIIAGFDTQIKITNLPPLKRER